MKATWKICLCQDSTEPEVLGGGGGGIGAKWRIQDQGFGKGCGVLSGEQGLRSEVRGGGGG